MYANLTFINSLSPCVYSRLGTKLRSQLKAHFYGTVWPSLSTKFSLLQFRCHANPWIALQTRNHLASHHANYGLDIFAPSLLSQCFPLMVSQGLLSIVLVQLLLICLRVRRQEQFLFSSYLCLPSQWLKRRQSNHKILRLTVQMQSVMELCEAQFVGCILPPKPGFQFTFGTQTQTRDCHMGCYDNFWIGQSYRYPIQGLGWCLNQALRKGIIWPRKNTLFHSKRVKAFSNIMLVCLEVLLIFCLSHCLPVK